MSSNDETGEPEVIIPDDPELSEDNNQFIPDADTTCTLCHAEFLDPDDLKIHIDQVHKIAPKRRCHFCLEGYHDLMEYAIHIRDNHLSSIKTCNHCWRIFEDFDEHRKHCKKHIISGSQFTFKCSQCLQRYGDPFLLKQHEYEHKNNTEGVMIHEVFPYLSAALKVKAVTLLDVMGKDVVYICVGCEFSTLDIEEYIRHAQSNICNVLVCHKCGNVFPKKQGLIKHVHSSCSIFGIKANRTRLCTDCDTYINARSFSKHKTRCKPIKCYICDVKFTSINEWSTHQSQEHAGMSVEVETCQYCWKRSVGREAMKKHIERIHKPEFHLYKYLCIYCNSVFKHPQKLFGHFVTKHKDISPYTCKICDKTFRFRKKFTIHIKLTHKSVGFVEFDENYHVIFTDKKSENPFIPKTIYTDEMRAFDPKLVDNSESVELNSDFINETETEVNQTESEEKRKREEKDKRKLKRKRTSKVQNDDSQRVITVDSSDEEESLLVVRKRVRLQKKKDMGLSVSRKRVTNRALLTCAICNKYCYTYRNYNHHISLHSKHDVKKCIKCSKIFKSKAKLNEHIAAEHSSSKLTETLKSLIQKRKTGRRMSEDLPQSLRFRRTIKKARTEITTTSAKITPVEQKISVQKFFENFVPEETKPESPIDSTATIKLLTGFQSKKEPTIRMKKFQPSPLNSSPKLAMPIRFVDAYPESTKVTVKIIEKPITVDENPEHYPNYSDDGCDMDRNESIPEVAEEVLLEGTEEMPKTTQHEQHKVVIPQLPTEITDIRIAHLLPQAPYYKIVKVKDVLTRNQEEKEELKQPSSIKLRDGTTLVTTNPLAHLLGKEQEKVLQSVKRKYYKPKKNFHGMLAKALTQLDRPTPKKQKTEGVKITEIR